MRVVALDDVEVRLRFSQHLEIKKGGASDVRLSSLSDSQTKVNLVLLLLKKYHARFRSQYTEEGANKCLSCAGFPESA